MSWDSINANRQFRRTNKTIAFTGAAGLGAIGSVALFTVTGAVEVILVAPCTVDLVGATATLEVGIVGNTAALIAQTTATGIDNGHIWVDASPATIESTPASKLIGVGQDILATVATAAITAGTLEFCLLWRPLNDTGLVVAA